MTKVQKTTDGWTSAIRWIARLLALASAGLFVAFIAMSGAKTVSALTWNSPQGIPLLIALVVAIVGVLIAWRWELIGGLMSIAGAIAIMALVCAGSGTDMLFCSVLFTLPLLAAGALYLGCCWRKRVVTGRA
jgi:hypothetical protein